MNNKLIVFASVIGGLFVVLLAVILAIQWPSLLEKYSAQGEKFKLVDHSDFEISRMNMIYSITPTQVSFINDGVSLEIEQADPESFELLGLCYGAAPYSIFYAKDRNNVYCGGQIIEQADPESFEIFGVYREFNPVGDSHGNFGVARDKNCFYYGYKQVKSENGECFKGTFLSDF